MDESVLGRVQAMTGGYGFTIRLSGARAAKFVSMVFRTDREAEEAREAMRDVIAKAIAIV